MLAWSESAWFSFFLDSAWKSAVVLAAAWITAMALRKNSAAARHLAWAAGLAGAAALPLIAIMAPSIRIPAAPTALVFRVSNSFEAAVSAPVPRLNSHPSSRTGIHAAPRLDWRLALMSLWAAGFAIALARILLACGAVRRARRFAKPFSDPALCEALSRTLGLRRSPAVLETRPGSMPMTFGVFRPTVFMPSESTDWSAGWNDARRRIVLLHELAHVKRGDVPTHWVARTALALYWWNPLAWKAWREFLKERERAADDLVLNAGARASDYAGHLLAVARAMRSAPNIGWAAVAMARRSQLENRLAAILDSRIRRNAPGRAWAIAAALAAVALVTPLAAVRAQDSAKSASPDVDVAIRLAQSQHNYDMLDKAAETAEQQRDYETAGKLLDTALQIRKDANGFPSAEAAVGLSKLADLASKQGQNQRAEELYSQAAQILGDRSEAAPALIYLGKSAIRSGSSKGVLPNAAREDFARAEEYLQLAQHADPSQAGTATMWMAVAKSREGDAAQAETLFQTALSRQDPKSTFMVTTLMVYSQFLKKQGRNDEAQEMAARASAAQKEIAAKPTFPSDVYRIGPGVSAPVPLTKAEPQYSEEARVALLMGTVALSLEIGTDGKAHNIQVVRSLGMGLDEKAAEAVEQWTFKPGMKDGQPVPVIAQVEVNFRLL
jgi:TonB family protein